MAVYLTEGDPVVGHRCSVCLDAQSRPTRRIDDEGALFQAAVLAASSVLRGPLSAGLEQLADAGEEPGSVSAVEEALSAGERACQEHPRFA